MNKVSGLFMAFMIAISLTGLAYAHWSDTVKIEGTVKMAHVKMTIKSYKCLTSKEIEKYSTITSELSDDAHTLTLTCDNLKPCWYVWVGLVTQNQGPLPVWVKPPVYTFNDPDDLNQYFEEKEYFYGPYPEATGLGDLEVWGKAKVDEELQSDGSVTFLTKPTTAPFIADPGEKVVIWIWIHVLPEIPPEAQGKTVIIDIHIVDDLAV